MTAAELAREPVILYERGGTIRRVVDDWFRRGRATPRVAMELGTPRRRRSWSAPGSASRSSRKSRSRPTRGPARLNLIPLRPALHRRIGIVRRRERSPRPALLAFMTALERAAKRVRGGRILDPVRWRR